MEIKTKFKRERFVVDKDFGKIVFLYVPNVNESDHYHIELSKKETFRLMAELCRIIALEE